MARKHIKANPLVKDLARCYKNASPKSRKLFYEATQSLRKSGETK